MLPSFAEIHAKYASDPYACEKTTELLAAHIAHARAVAEADPHAAIAHLREAETLQIQIGTWATGSGEGLASMHALYELRLERARLHERLGELDDAAKIEAEITADPNRVGRELLRRHRARRTK